MYANFKTSIMRKYNVQTILLIALLLGAFNQFGYTKSLISKADSLILQQQFGRANKFYANMAYLKAIHKYQYLISKGYVTDSLNRNLAQAYFKIDSTQESETLYRQLAQSAQPHPFDYFFLAQSLKSNEKYKEADAWMAKYNEATPSDSRGERQKNSASKISEIQASNNYSLSTVPFNSKYSDFGAVVRENKIIFASARENNLVIKRKYAWNETPYLDIFSVNESGDSSSVAVAYSSKLNSIYHDGPIGFSANGNELFLTRNNFNAYLPKSGDDGVNHLKILHSKKTVSGWSEPTELPFNGNNFSTGHPALSQSGDTLFFASDRPGGYGNSDLYFVTKTTLGWSEPQNLGSQINSEGDEMFPFIDAKGILYFASNGQLGLGGLDIFGSQKGYDGKYIIKNLGVPINSSNDDFAFYLQNNGKSGYIASNRPGGLGDDDIYRFDVRHPLSFNNKMYLKGFITDSLTQKELAHSTIQIKNKNGEILKTIDTKNSNNFQIEVNPKDQLTIASLHDGYFDKNTSVMVSNLVAKDGIVSLPITLKSRPIEPIYGLYGNVFILPQKEPVTSVSLKIHPRNGEADKDITTDSLSGNFKTKLTPNTDYDLVFQKKAFFTKRAYYSTVGKDTGFVNLNQFVELAIEKVELGKSIEILVLYDLGKYDIRQDAAQELDDMVDFLNDNPTISIELSSHTDSRGSTLSNQTLSQKRAESAVAYIVSKGILQTRITAVGYGETRLKNKCGNGVKCSEAEHQQNRRTEVKIIGM